MTRVGLEPTTSRFVQKVVALRQVQSFESFSGYFHSHKLSRLIKILLVLKFTPATLSSGGTAMVSLLLESRRPSVGPV